MSADVSLERALEHCLQELIRTDECETCLKNHPQHAARLRPLLEIAQETREHHKRVPEAPGGLLSGRERMLAAAAQQRAKSIPATAVVGTTTQTGSRRMMSAFKMRLAAIMLVVVLSVVGFGGGLVKVASGSLPGDPLYPVKTTVEDIRFTLASAPSDQVDLALQFIEERVEEVEGLAAIGRHIPDRTVDRMAQHVEHALIQAAWAADDKAPGLLMQIADRTRTQSQILEHAQTRASQQAQAGLRRAAAVCHRGAEAAEDGLRDPDAFQQRFRHRQGEPDLSTEPWQEQEKNQHGNQEEPQDGQFMPTRVQTAMPQKSRVTSTLQISPQGIPTTSTVEAAPDAPIEMLATSTSTPAHVGPQATSTPQPAPQGPQETSTPEAAPMNPRETPTAEAAPVGPQTTLTSEPAPKGPQTTPTPEVTSSSLKETPTPKATSKGARATATPKSPRGTPTPKATP